MRNTIEDVIRACEICLTTKYDDRHPTRETQEETATAGAPLTELVIDTFTWKGYKFVNMRDLFRNAVMAYWVQKRSWEAVLKLRGHEFNSME